MGIFPNRQLNQTAVYWGNPVKDGQGGFTWDDPVEIACRWNDSISTQLAANGKEFLSIAKVQVEQDVDKNGMLFLGNLIDLDSSVEADPPIGDDTYTIKRFDKTPTVNSQEFFRRVFL